MLTSDNNKAFTPTMGARKPSDDVDHGQLAHQDHPTARNHSLT